MASFRLTATFRSSLLGLFFLFLIRLLFIPSHQAWNYEIDFTPRRVPASRSTNILILVVVNSDSKMSEYKYPLGTLLCYAKKHNYQIKIVEDHKFRDACNQSDFMFRRHCIAAKFLRKADYTLILDADIAVVNPNVLIEQYLDKDADIIMYNRFFCWEVAMGSLLVKNTSWAVGFLEKFANFEKELPNSYHGSDNGAIHTFIVKELLPEALPFAQQCLAVWRTSVLFEDLLLFEACMRSVMGERERIGKLLIVPKGRAWVRDGWLTNSRWSPERDFMLHGYKSADRHVRTGISAIDAITETISSRYMWYPFTTKDLSSDYCHWKYDLDLMVSKEEIDGILLRRYRLVERLRWKTSARLATENTV